MTNIKKYLENEIYTDLYKYEGENFSKFKYYKNLIINRGFKYTVLKRKTKYYKDRNKMKFLYYRILMRLYSSKTGFQFPYNVNIGQGFKIIHWGRLIINEDVIIGKNVTVSSGVVIGKEFRGKRKGVPVIGDEVYIGANAIIVGKVKIGSNVLIAPNAYINNDVPSNSIVIGNPAIIIRDKIDATEGYILNKVK